ncbi:MULTISPECIES: dihydroneopterin aldolase family protein [Methanobacterium]|uniref:Dihydroneopterin aldolase n=1 Tax=Methanobacterium bryantii TaxID=2161 RepID=A0A2A2H579_METBR|nr:MULTISPECIES: dihydroneopterin aldolase family protein [Methanobacterium]OEC88275.1 dihydroneopterin aldolase [Methanobacterium sp. A39]PAV04464.1 dihydroneopterin aldolase [Methanobacterium bryantii]
MDIEDRYFKNISSRERVIFEGAITMGALFHQFVGTPVNSENAETLEKSIKEAMELQPCIEEVEVKIDRKMLEEAKSKFNYVSLNGDMLDIRVVSKYADKKAVLRMEYIEELKYPLMYVEDINE